jgi:hypothetical protein
MRSATPFIALCLIVAGCGGSDGSSTGPAATLTVTIPSGPVPSGKSVQASASITTGSGSSPASGVTWTSANEAFASVDANGLITGHRQGNAIIRAKSGTLTGEVHVIVVPGDPASIVVYAGNGQVGTRGAPLPDPLCTNVKDAAGNLITGITVTYVVSTGNGQLASPTSPPTDGQGIAISGGWTLGPNAGSQTVTASAAGAGSVTFTATAQ